MRKRFYNPYFTPMQYSPALWLDASDQSTLVMDGARVPASATIYLSCASNSSLQTGNTTWCCGAWVYTTAYQAYPLLLHKSSGLSSAVEWRVTYSNDANRYLYLEPGNGSVAIGGSSFTTTTLPLSTWTFIFFGYNADTGLTFMSVNNGSFATGSPSGPGTSAAPFCVGGVNGFSGRVDSVFFGKPTGSWLTSNAAALASYLYNSGSGRRSSDFLASSYYINGNPSGAVSWWDMDARSGTETDRIGTNHLTDNGGVGYAAGVASGLVQYTGDPVKQWSDKSGNARHVTAASDAARPTYVTAAQNGLSGITFDGTDDALISASFANAMPRWLFIVAKIAASYTGVIHHGTSDTDELFACAVGTNGYYSDVGDVVGPYVDNLTAIGAGSHVFGFEWYTPSINTILTYSLDGVYTTPTVSNPTIAPNTLAKTLTVGARTTSFFPGQIYEVIYGSGMLSQFVSMQFVRYLGNKWGITLP